MTLFAANAILIGDTRNAMRGVSGNADAYARHTYLDWLRTQDESYTENPGDSWLLLVPELYSRRAPGNTCLQALHDGAKGSIGEPANNSKGCGGIMRVAPAGLYFENPETAAKQAGYLAAVTHGHPLGYIPASAFAFIVNRCAYDAISADKDATASFWGTLEACGSVLQATYPNHPNAVAYTCELMEKAYRLAVSDASELDALPRLGEGWVAEETLAIALFAAIRHFDSFDEALRCAVNHSGDSDSTGVVCGSIMGALLGIEAIGGKWTENLELVNVILEISKDLCDRCQMDSWGNYSDKEWSRKCIHAGRRNEGV